MKRMFEKPAVNLFCKNTSLRVVSKVSKSESKFLRLLWFLFGVSMFSLLIYTSYKAIADFLSYKTITKQVYAMEHASIFPALTFCANQPFDHSAVKLWESNEVMSPSNFSHRIHRLMRENFKRKRYVMASQLYKLDSLQTYYQNLPSNDSRRVSHSIKNLLAYCSIRKETELNAVSDRLDCGSNIRIYSSPSLFNCFTLDIKENHMFSLQSLELIFEVPQYSIPDIYKTRSSENEDFAGNLGGELIIHERDTLPRMDYEKIHIEANSLTEIVYGSMETRRDNLLNVSCYSEQEKSSRHIQDLEHHFAYTRTDCVNSRVADYILNKCGCFDIKLPRPGMPNKTFPYCHALDSQEEWEKRTHCLEHSFPSMEFNRQSAKICQRRCSKQKFQTRISKIKWEPKSWQVQLLINLNRLWFLVLNHTHDKVIWRDSFHHLTNYMKGKSTIAPPPPDVNPYNNYHTGFACVVVRRNSNNTFITVEQTSLSLSGLFSRIGGMSSLYLGLTSAVMIEMIEYCVLMIKGEYKAREDQEEKKECQDDQVIKEFTENNFTETELQVLKETPQILSDVPGEKRNKSCLKIDVIVEY